jgi:hypothetical protein
MTIIFIENVLGSGQIVTVAETFKQQTIERNLRPGESGRFFTSPLKSIVVNESIMAENSGDVAITDTPFEYMPHLPIKLTMHSHDD